MGALSLDRVEAEAVVIDGKVSGINTRRKNRATDLIENFMVAANGVMARTLSQAGVSSIARVVQDAGALAANRRTGGRPWGNASARHPIQVRSTSSC